jgi:hypothetical protein
MIKVGIYQGHTLCYGNMYALLMELAEVSVRLGEIFSGSSVPDYCLLDRSADYGFQPGIYHQTGFPSQNLSLVRSQMQCSSRFE